MMEANVVRASNFEQTIRALDVRLNKRCGIGDRVIVMRLGGKMHDGIVPGTTRSKSPRSQMSPTTRWTRPAGKPSMLRMSAAYVSLSSTVTRTSGA